jgi:putative intracellular protease/amidase
MGLPDKCSNHPGSRLKFACDEPSATDLNGRMIPVDVLLKEVRSTDYDAIVIIGGYSVWKYIGNPDVNRLLQSFYESGKIVGAICAGTYVLL